MTKVESIVENQKRKAAEKVRADLVKNAVECTYYVALGKVAKRELAEQFGITEQDAEGILSREACRLVDEIRDI